MTGFFDSAAARRRAATDRIGIEQIRQHRCDHEYAAVGSILPPPPRKMSARPIALEPAVPTMRRRGLVAACIASAMIWAAIIIAVLRSGMTPWHLAVELLLIGMGCFAVATIRRGVMTAVAHIAGRQVRR